MNLSKRRLVELCPANTFEELHTQLEQENSCTIPKATLRNLLKQNNLKCKNSRMTLTLVDDDTDIIVDNGGQDVYFAPISHPASQVTQY